MVEGKRTIAESLAEFVHDDLLTDDNKYSIEGKGKVDAMKGTKFLELPPVLHLHLQRFSYDPRTGRPAKIDSFFQFPFELNMGPYVADTMDRSQCLMYELVSVLVHWGSPMGGHYYAFCRPTQERDWFKFNDHEVEEAKEDAVMDANFGGSNRQFSAYFLVYVRQSDLERVMQPVPETAIPLHLHEYLHEWKQARKDGPKEYRLRVLSDRAYAQELKASGLPQDKAEQSQFISVPCEYRFNDFLIQLKLHAGLAAADPCSLWLVTSTNFPGRRIHPNLTVKDRMTEDRKTIFVSSFADDPQPDEVPLLIAFYDPSILTYPLQYSHFTVLSPAQTLEGVRAEIIKRYGLGDAPVDAYVQTEGTIRQLDITGPIGQQEVRYGLVVFQLASPDLVKKPAPEGLAVFRAIDFLPEYSCPTVKDFYLAAERTVLFNIAPVNTPDAVAFRLDIDPAIPITSLFRCVRQILSVPPTDSILLFDREHGKTTPNPQPIARGERTPISQAVHSRWLYCHVLKGVTQEGLAGKVMLKLSVVDQSLAVIDQPILLLPKVYNGRAILGQLIGQGNIPADANLRLLQLSGSRIVKLVTDIDSDLSAMTGFTWRAEIIPDDQIDVSTNELVRVTLTHNRQVPRAACFGSPFLFKPIAGEKFAETKDRLIALAGVERDKATFGYTNECQDLKDYKILKDDDELASLLHGSSTMVYIFLPGAHAQSLASGKSFWNRGVSIYN
jgi:hypothetical protein